MRRRSIIAATIAAGLVALFATAASGQSALVVAIRQATLDANGQTRLVVSVTGDNVNQTLTKTNFAVTESGKPVSGITVAPLLQSNVESVYVDLLVDTSGSTAGQASVDERNAAKSFVNSLPAGVQIGLIQFSDGAVSRSGFTSNKATINRAIDGFRPGGSTALYDAIKASANRLQPLNGQHNIVVFTDGKDTVNRTTLAQATAAAKAASAPVTVVGLQTTDFDAGAVNAIATSTRGRVVSVTQSSALAGAFQQVAKEIASQYVVTYTGTDTTTKSLNLVVSVSLGGATNSDTISVINSRSAPGTTNGPHVGPLPGGEPKPIVGFFAGKAGLYVGIAGVFLAALLFVGMLLWQPSGGRAAKVLQRGLRLYTRSERRRKPQSEGGISSTAIGRRAVEIVERMPKSEGFEQKLQLLLDRAGWPLRASEFVIFQVLGVIVGAILGFGLFQRWWLGIVLVVFGFLVPRLVLAQKVAKRSSDFLSQLPDTLQLLAGSLQAGYAFLQAIDTIVREAPPPTSTEFARVLSEARLGMAVEDALDQMSERIGSEDFRWVVLAINIQRQVGGNLATLLTTVADTLREREQVRRQIKVLSAEGRLSAVILVILPFAIAGYIALANPSYLHPLFSTGFGKVLVGFAIVMMGLGIVWMRKIIKIDV